MTNGLGESTLTDEELSRPSTEVQGGSLLSGLVARVPDPNIWRIYGTTVALGIAYGIAISVLAIFLKGRGYEADIGKLAAWFAAGIVVFSLPMGPLIRRFSAKWVLAASLAGYAMAVTAFPYLPSFGAIAAVRFFDGACSVGVWVSSESILLSRAGKHDKAFATSLYAIAVACGYVGGPLVAALLTRHVPLPVVFVVSGVIALSASAFVALRLAPDLKLTRDVTHENGVKRPTTSLAAVLWRIKTSCFGTFAYGYFQASVVLFLPIYLTEHKGISNFQSFLIPAFFAGGMLLFSNVAGRLGDRFGHLLLMRLLGIIGMGCVLGFVWLDAYPAMCVAVFIAGASLASISPISLALQGVVARPHEYERATSIYNAFYACGMLIGPPISGYLNANKGGAVMLFQLAALWAAFIAFAWLFRGDDPAWARSRA